MWVSKNEESYPDIKIIFQVLQECDFKNTLANIPVNFELVCFTLFQGFIKDFVRFCSKFRNQQKN
jgi:hypothetical protein